MLLIWLVGAAFLYWPFTKWEATYKAPILSALLWPLMAIFLIFFVLWAKFLNKNNKNIVKSELPLHEISRVLARRMVSYTSTSDERIALAKQLIIEAETDLKHEFYYPRGMNPDLKQNIDFSLHSRKFLNFYNECQLEAEEHIKRRSQISHKDYDPRDFSDSRLNNLDLFEIKNVFNSLVERFRDPREKFQAKLLIIDKML
ncbi:hypothetical protein ACG9XS_21015 [Acinetobacter gyllenbergii]|uniref:hypothetical protein n=1 Tax=Acinetobacter gyllenbergii TaxID=134534 RepID=UPI0003BF5FD7|nr:hypothetical protein [Acinetobacter gyllenbergii]ESK56827.1 hypothetical protein F987_00318 [Acinetobacter gyllenbergii NIPH 230]